MELLEDELLSLAILILKKAKIEQKLRATFKCMLRKMFSCCGLKNIENELKYLNESINEIKLKSIKKKSIKKKSMKLKRFSSI
tara:strand:+ start:149 stop:397 length:249 start_codon:yes stop_codon:yes gene_type:complete